MYAVRGVRGLKNQGGLWGLENERSVWLGVCGV